MSKAQAWVPRFNLGDKVVANEVVHEAKGRKVKGPGQQVKGTVSPGTEGTIVAVLGPKNYEVHIERVDSSVLEAVMTLPEDALDPA